MADEDVIAANIARLRKKRGMSQAALADAMRGAGHDHWRQNTVSRIENRRQSPTLGELEALSALLGQVTQGTTFASSLQTVAQRWAEQSTVHRLRLAHEALSEAQRAIHELRLTYDDEYRRSKPDETNERS